MNWSPKALASSTEATATIQVPTQSTCESFARHILQTTDLQPVENQGSTSYNLISPSQNQILQSRLKRFDERNPCSRSQDLRRLSPLRHLPWWVSPPHLHQPINPRPYPHLPGLPTKCRIPASASTKNDHRPGPFYRQIGVPPAPAILVFARVLGRDRAADIRVSNRQYLPYGSGATILMQSPIPPAETLFPRPSPARALASRLLGVEYSGSSFHRRVDGRHRL